MTEKRLGLHIVNILSASNKDEKKDNFYSLYKDITLLAGIERDNAIEGIIPELLDNNGKLLQDFFNYIDSQLLPLLRIMSEYSGLGESLVGMLVKGTNFKKLVAVGKQGESELTLLMECLALTFMTISSKCPLASQTRSTFTLIKELVLLVDTEWKNEMLVHNLVMFVSSLGHHVKFSSVEDVDFLPSISNILIKMHKMNPRLVSMNRKVVIPVASPKCVLRQYSTIYIWLFGLTRTLSDFPSNREALVPIISDILRDFNLDKHITQEEQKDGLIFTILALRDLLSSTRDAYHREVVAANCMVHLMGTQDTFHDVIGIPSCAEPLPVQCVRNFFEYHIHLTHRIERRHKEALLPNFVAIISSRKLLRYDMMHGPLAKNKCPDGIVRNKYFAQNAIYQAAEYIREEAEGLVMAIMDSQLVPCLIKFALGTRAMPDRPFVSFIQAVGDCFCAIASVVGFKNTTNHMDIINELKTFLSFDKAIWLSSVDKVNDGTGPVCAILHAMVINTEAFNFRSFDKIFEILVTYLDGLKHADHQILERLLHFLCQETDYRPGLLDPYFVTHFPVFWSKMCDENNQAWNPMAIRQDGMRLTINAALHAKLNGISTNQLLDLETLMVSWITDTEKPIAAGGLRLAWLILSRNPGGPLSKELLRKREMEFPDKKTGNFTGLQFLTDTIVGYLDKKPSYPIQYLFSLTRCLTEIARESSSQQEKFLLKNLVSPVLAVVKNVPHRGNAANVREFLNLIH